MKEALHQAFWKALQVYVDLRDASRVLCRGDESMVRTSEVSIWAGAAASAGAQAVTQHLLRKDIACAAARRTNRAALFRWAGCRPWTHAQ
jgi:hypothetical protein